MNFKLKNLRFTFSFRRGLLCTGCFFLLSVQNNVFGAINKPDSSMQSITINMKNATVKDVISEIESQGEYYFTYSSNQINIKRIVSIQVKNNSIETVLKKLFTNQGIRYSIENNHVVLYKEKTPNKNSVTTSNSQTNRKVTGIVCDKLGPIIGASIFEKGTTNGTITDMDGNFTLNVNEGAILEISYVGYVTQHVKVGIQKNFKIDLKRRHPSP